MLVELYSFATFHSNSSDECIVLPQFVNIQNRLSNLDKPDDMATLQVVRQILQVLDDFDRAFGAVTPETDDQRAIEQDYRRVYESILAIFQELGVEEIATVGTEFDYELHQAVMQKPSAEYEEGIVCEEFQKGFRIGKKHLVRAAMVAVAA